MRVSPRDLSALATADTAAKRTLGTWREAVEIANRFLESSYRKTLPPGKFTLSDTGMIYHCASGDIPLQVRCTSFGDMLVSFNFAAQERTWGFVVGRTKGSGSRLVQNSLFCNRNGHPQGNIAVAAIILHETTHIYFKEGIDSPANFIRYYAEAIFLLRYREHSMERRPYATSKEFDAFIVAERKEHPEQFYQVTTTLPGPDRRFDGDIAHPSP